MKQNTGQLQEKKVLNLLLKEKRKGKLIVWITSICLLFFTGCKKETKPGDETAAQTIRHTGTAVLSQARSSLAAAAAGNKIVFAGGYYVDAQGDDQYSSAVDIYDVSINKWTTAQLSVAREGLAAAAAGNKIVFAGGADDNRFMNNVDIYDVSTNTWTTARLSVSRTQLTAAATGNKILFAGGYDNSPDGVSKVVDVYDVVTGSWTTTQLSEARYLLTGAAIGNKIYFGGGLAGFASRTVDIYDVSTGVWTKAELSKKRLFLAAAAAGNKVLFAGGIDPLSTDHTTLSRTVDIYDKLTDTWTTALLSQGTSEPTGAGLGNKILFAGGTLPNSAYSDVVDVYDAATGKWEILQLSIGRTGMAAAGAGNKILVAGGVGTTAEIDLKTVDIFTLSN